MDCIRGCDLDLKEHGKLLRQNEFLVITGRRKAQRRIFLFEKLCLFAKPKKTTQGGDIYQYKHSWQVMSDFLRILARTNDRQDKYFKNYSDF